MKGPIVNRIFLCCHWSIFDNLYVDLTVQTDIEILESFNYIIPNIMKKPVKMKHMSNPETDQHMTWEAWSSFPSSRFVSLLTSISPIC